MCHFQSKTEIMWVSRLWPKRATSKKFSNHKTEKMEKVLLPHPIKLTSYEKCPATRAILGWLLGMDASHLLQEDELWTKAPHITLTDILLCYYGHWVASSPSTEARKLPRSLTCSNPNSRATLPNPSRGSLWADECSPTSWTVEARWDVTVPQQFRPSSANAGTTVTASSIKVRITLWTKIRFVLLLFVNIVILIYFSFREHACSMSQCTNETQSPISKDSWLCDLRFLEFREAGCDALLISVPVYFTLNTHERISCIHGLSQWTRCVSLPCPIIRLQEIYVFR